MDYVRALKLQLDKRVDGNHERHDVADEAAFLVYYDAVFVGVVPAELVPADDDRHLLVGDRLKVLLQGREAVARNYEHDYQPGYRPGDFEAGVTVDLRGHVPHRLARTPVAENDPQKRRFDADEDDDRRDRDPDIGVVDVLTIGGDGRRE